MKQYYCYKKNIDINYLKIRNILMESLINKYANEKILILGNHLKLEKFC